MCIRDRYSINGKKLNLGRHTKLQNLYEQQDIIGVDLNTYYKFLTVRHPYTRFMSAWLYFTQYQKTAERHNLKKVEDMMDWIEDGANKIHILPQVNWHDERFDDVIKLTNDYESRNHQNQLLFVLIRAEAYITNAKHQLANIDNKNISLIGLGALVLASILYFLV